ncbi:MAG: hypothetical protein ACE5FH_06515 [Candidatus Zixiibacteriota bacterium]
MYKITRTRLAAALVVLPLVAWLLAGCSSKSQSDSLPAGTDISVSASPNSVATGGTSVVEATVSSGGRGVANQIVVFSITPTDAGFFTPSVDTTDASGVAAAVFTATKSGSATVTAGMEGTSVSSTAGITVTQTSQSGSDNIDIAVTPSLLLANGTDTSQVVVTVRDGDGNPAPDGTLLKFAAGEKFVDVDGNGYWSSGIDSLVFDANGNGQWDAIGLVPSTAVTSGGTGSVIVNYVAGSDALTVYVKVTIDDNTLTGSAEVSLQLSPDATIASIFLQSDSMSLSVKQTGGIESSVLHAVCLDPNANNVPEGLSVNFVIVDGPGGGEHLANVGLGPFAAVTNGQGVASVSIHSGTISGTVRIRAYADTVLSNATQVLITAGPPKHIVIGTEELNVPWFFTVGNRLDVTAVVSDTFHNPVNDSTVVYFTTSEGTMKSHELRTIEHEGIATTRWFSGNTSPYDSGRVWVYAETAGGTVLDSSMFYNSWTPYLLTVLGAPASMLADGEEEVSVIVVAVDLNGNPVVGGTEFEGEAGLLSVGGGSFEDGWSSSSDRVKIKSVNLTRDRSMTGVQDDGIGAVDNVTFWTKSGASVTIQIPLRTSTAYKRNSELFAQATALKGEVVSMYAVMKDRYGNPLGNHTINMTATAGTVTGATQKTNAFGEANGFIWTAPDTASAATIMATDVDPLGGLILTKGIIIE